MPLAYKPEQNQKRQINVATWLLAVMVDFPCLVAGFYKDFNEIRTLKTKKGVIRNVLTTRGSGRTVEKRPAHKKADLVSSNTTKWDSCQKQQKERVKGGE